MLIIARKNVLYVSNNVFNLQSDLKCISDAKGHSTVYRDHLPLLGQHQHPNGIHRHQQVLQNMNEFGMQLQQLEIGDRVRN